MHGMTKVQCSVYNGQPLLFGNTSKFMCTPNDKDSKHRGGKMLIMTSTDCAAGSISYACTFKLTSTQTCITKKTHTVN